MIENVVYFADFTIQVISTFEFPELADFTLKTIHNIELCDKKLLETATGPELELLDSRMENYVRTHQGYEAPGPYGDYSTCSFRAANISTFNNINSVTAKKALVPVPKPLKLSSPGEHLHKIRMYRIKYK